MKTNEPCVCKLLRTKGGFGAVQGNDWKEGTSNTDVFWCLNTMETAGPDEGYVHAKQCRKGRACFQDPDESSEPVA